MPHTISAVFDDHDTAARAVRLLRDKQFTDKELSVVGSIAESEAKAHQEAIAKDDVRASAWTGTALGAAVGGYAGLLSMALLPALPLFVVGGAAAGAIAGGLGGFGVADKDVSEAEDSLRAGGVLIVVREEDEERARVALEVLEGADARTVGMSNPPPATPEA